MYKGNVLARNENRLEKMVVLEVVQSDVYVYIHAMQIFQMIHRILVNIFPIINFQLSI